MKRNGFDFGEEGKGEREKESRRESVSVREREKEVKKKKKIARVYPRDSMRAHKLKKID